MKLANTRLVRTITLTLLLATVALPALAEVVEVGADKDNTLYESLNGGVSNGAGSHLFVGKTLQGFEDLRRAVLAFDVAGAVPAGATVTGASLTLNMSMTIVGDESVSLHRLVSDWGESTSDAPGQEGGGTAAQAGDATWLHRFFDDTDWNTPGGDFARIASATQTVGDQGSYTWTSATMAEDVQEWLDNPGGNSGWIVIGNESDVSAKRFDSRENADENLRPVLTIEYVLGDVPATSNIGVVLLIALTLLAGSAYLMRRGPIVER